MALSPPTTSTQDAFALPVVVWGAQGVGKTTLINGWINAAMREFGASFDLALSADHARSVPRLNHVISEAKYLLSLHEMRDELSSASLHAMINTSPCVFVWLYRSGIENGDVASSAKALNQALIANNSLFVILAENKNVDEGSADLEGEQDVTDSQVAISPQVTISIPPWAAQLSRHSGCCSSPRQESSDKGSGITSIIQVSLECAQKAANVTRSSPRRAASVDASSGAGPAHWVRKRRSVVLSDRPDLQPTSLPAMVTSPLSPGRNTIEPSSSTTEAATGNGSASIPSSDTSSGWTKPSVGSTNSGNQATSFPAHNSTSGSSTVPQSPPILAQYSQTPKNTWSTGMRPTTSARANMMRSEMTPLSLACASNLSVAPSSQSAAQQPPPKSPESLKSSSSGSLATTSDRASPPSSTSAKEQLEQRNADSSRNTLTSSSYSNGSNASSSSSLQISTSSGLTRSGSTKIQTKALNQSVDGSTKLSSPSPSSSGTLKRKFTPAGKLAVDPELLLEEMPPKQFARLPATTMATITLAASAGTIPSVWYTTPMRFRVENKPSFSLIAFYTAENHANGIQTPEMVIKMQPFSATPVEAPLQSLSSGISNNGLPISVFVDSAAPHFFWIREPLGMSSNNILLTATDSTDLSNYLRQAWPGISFGTMKPGAYMSIFVTHWAEHCGLSIPPEPKRLIDLACAEQSASKYLIESMELFETPPEAIPSLCRCIHWLPCLCELTFHGCGITDEQAVPMLNSLILNPYIKSISLAQNQLGSGSVPAIAALLKRPSKRLMILDLSGNAFPLKSTAPIFDALAGNTCVKRFSFTGGVPLSSKSAIQSVAGVIEKNRSLFCLRLTLQPQGNDDSALTPIFDALMNNTALSMLDLGLESTSPILMNIESLVKRNTRGVSSATLAGWLSHWPALLDFIPTKLDHLQKATQAAQKGGVTWKRISTFTATLEDGPEGSLTVSLEGISFAAKDASQTLHFPWSSTLKLGQLTIDPVLLVVYDPSTSPNPLVMSVGTPQTILEMVVTFHAILPYFTKPLQLQQQLYSGNRPRTNATHTPVSMESLLDFSQAQVGPLLAASGGSGTEVRVATITGFQTCVKIMDCSKYGQTDVDGLEREISLLIMCKKSKHVVNYLHHEKNGNELRLYMELFPTSLRKLISSRAPTKNYFTATQVWILARKMLKGLEFLHSQPQPIVHRDIKTDNVLVEEDSTGGFSRVKLTDFGSAKILTRGRTGSFDMGTSGYQAPEMFTKLSDGSLSYSTAVDIFSFGISLYEILALQRVFNTASSRKELEEALRNAEKLPPEASLIPRHLLEFYFILLPCLKLNYNDRPTASQLLTQLDQLAQRLSIGKYAEPAPQTTPRGWTHSAQTRATLDPSASSSTSTPTTSTSMSHTPTTAPSGGNQTPTPVPTAGSLSASQELSDVHL